MVLVQHTYEVGCGLELHRALFVLGSMWFGVIATLKNQRTGTTHSKEMEKTHCTVQYEIKS